MGKILPFDDISDPVNKSCSRSQLDGAAQDVSAFLAQLVGQYIRDVDAGRSILQVPDLPAEPEPGFNVAGHAKLFFQLAGENLLISPRATMRMQPGNICIVPSGFPHRERRVFHDGLYAHIFLAAHPDRVHYHLHKPIPHGPRITRNATASRGTPRAALLLPLMAALTETGKHESSPVLRKGLLLALLGRLLEIIDPAEEKPPVNPLIARCKERVLRQLEDPRLSVASLAVELKVHPDYLSRAFSSFEGIRLNAFITDNRIQHAKALLVDGSFHVAEVAYRTGFTSRAYFAKVFRKRTGCSPTTYRRQAPDW